MIKKAIYQILLCVFTISCFCQKQKYHDVYDTKMKSHIIFTDWDKNNAVWKTIFIKDSNGNIKSLSPKNVFYFDTCSITDISPDGKYIYLNMYQIGKTYDYNHKSSDVNKPYCGFLNIINMNLTSTYGSNTECDGSWNKKDVHTWIYDEGKSIKNFMDIDAQKIDTNDSSINQFNIASINDLAYIYWQERKFNEALPILKNIIISMPDRVVAYLNIADAYWGLNQKENAKENYNKYVRMMKAQNKDLKKIPAYVYARI